jgi:hypothetical protein
MRTLTIQYCFTLTDGSREVFYLEFDSENFDLTGNIPETLPAWTSLDFHQCPHCPLDKSTYPHCPVAANIVNIVSHFDGVLSYDEVHLEVVTEERQISQTTTAQKGICSMMGLIFATSGCPHASYFKPMARFHLPLSTEEETIYRAASMYLLAQYFLKEEGRSADLELEGLTAVYENVQILNLAMARRLREATKTDSSLNALILLDAFAKTMPMVIEESLRGIRHLFAPFFLDFFNKGEPPP